MDNAPQIGDQFTLRMGTYIDLPQTGSDQVWDYSGITSGAALSHQFENAAGNEFAGEYPEASLVLTGNGVSEFFHVDSSGVFGYGSVGDLGWGQYRLDVPFRRIAFPLYHGASWQDDWSGFQGGTVISGTRSCTANGSGDLVLPWGTVQNVIRVSCTDQAQIDDGSTTIELESVNFYANGFPWEILRATERTVLEEGQQISPTQRTLLYATEVSVVSIDGISAEASPLMIYTDLNGDLQIILNVSLVKPQMLLFNSAGALMAQKGSVAGRFSIATQDLPAGVYVLHVISDRGRSFQQKVIIPAR